MAAAAERMPELARAIIVEERELEREKRTYLRCGDDGVDGGAGTAAAGEILAA
jgi:hypothetical protein